MQYKSLSFLLLATVAVAQQSLDDYLDDTGYSDKLNSLEALASKTDVNDFLTNLPTDYTVPSVGDLPTPPPSIASVLATAIPTSFLSSMMNQQGLEDFASSVQNGDYPQWYKDLPGDVKTYISTAYGAMATADATTTGGSSEPTGDSSDSGSAESSTSEGLAAPTGGITAGLVGAAGILVLAIVL